MLTRQLIIYLILVILSVESTKAQEMISLRQLFQWVETEHPIAKQGAIYESISKNQLESVGKSWLPQASLNAQATYQSAVAGVNIPAAGINLASLPKDQYRATLDISQPLYDGGMTASQKQLYSLNEKVSTEKSKVDLYSLKQQVMQQFINILLCDKQLAILDLTNADLTESAKKLEQLYKNQYATKAAVAQIQSQIIKVKQKKLDITYTRKNLINNLSILCNKSIDEKNSFMDDVTKSVMIQNIRPEIKMFDVQRENAIAQLNMVKAKNRPKLNLFAQGGYGRPGLNMLSPYFDFFYIGGVKLSVPISGYYSFSQDKQLSILQSKLVENQKEIWMKNTIIQSKQNLNELEKLTKQLELDEENIKNLEIVVDASKAKFKENMITLDEYTQSLNDLETARLNQSVNQIQVLNNKLQAIYLSGNL